MRAKKVDDNQAVIVRQLRRLGISVQHLHTVGKGCPDLLLGHRGKNYLVELKDGSKAESKKRLTPDEQRFFDDWHGQVNRCDTLEEILRVIGM